MSRGVAEALGETGHREFPGQPDAVAWYAWAAWGYAWVAWVVGVFLGEDTLVVWVAVQLEWVQLANRLALVSQMQSAVVVEPSLGRAWVAGSWVFGQELGPPPGPLGYA